MFKNRIQDRVKNRFQNRVQHRDLVKKYIAANKMSLLKITEMVKRAFIVEEFLKTKQNVKKCSVRAYR